MGALEIVGAIALYVIGSVALAYATMWVVLLVTPKHWGLAGIALAARAVVIVGVFAAVVGLVWLGFLIGER